MDFVTDLSRTSRKHGAVWVVVDRLMKSANFLPISKPDSVSKLNEQYIKEIVRLHGVPVTIISD